MFQKLMSSWYNGILLRFFHWLVGVVGKTTGYFFENSIWLARVVYRLFIT